VGEVNTNELKPIFDGKTFNVRFSKSTKTIVIIVAILSGLCGLFYSFILGGIGVFIAYFATLPSLNETRTEFQVLAIRIAFVLNFSAFSAPFILGPLGLGNLTPSELSGIVCVLLIPILFGVYAYNMAKALNKNRWIYPLIVMGITGISMFAILILGNRLIPTFRFQHIWVIFFSALALLLNFVLVQLIFSGSSENTRILKFKNIVLIIVAFAVLHYKAYDYNTWGFRKALPFWTWDVHEWSLTDGFLPDYSYCLKAKMTRSEFIEYIAQYDLKLNPTTPKQDRDFMPPPSWSSPFEPNDSWWNVTLTMDSTYYIWPKADNWTMAKYEHGYLYLHSNEW
jgi:hypothetical protein